MLPLSITLWNSDNFAVIQPNSTSLDMSYVVVHPCQGTLGNLATGDPGESGTRGLMGIRDKGLKVYQIQGT